MPTSECCPEIFLGRLSFEINPERDLTWFYLIGALLVSVSLIALYTLRTNHRLARILLAKKVQQALLV